MYIYKCAFVHAYVFYFAKREYLCWERNEQPTHSNSRYYTYIYYTFRRRMREVFYSLALIGVCMRPSFSM